MVRCQLGLWDGRFKKYVRQVKLRSATPAKQVRRMEMAEKRKEYQCLSLLREWGQEAERGGSPCLQKEGAWIEYSNPNTNQHFASINIKKPSPNSPAKADKKKVIQTGICQEVIPCKFLTMH